MKLHTTRGETVEARLTTEHPMSNYGMPVLVDDQGNAYGSLETINWFILNATPRERRQLYCAGYHGVRDLEGEVRR